MKNKLVALFFGQSVDHFLVSEVEGFAFGCCHDMYCLSLFGLGVSVNRTGVRISILYSGLPEKSIG